MQAVVGSCELLNVRGLGTFGPWREAITDPGNCVSWSKDDAQYSGEYAVMRLMCRRYLIICVLIDLMALLLCHTDWLINMARATSLMAVIFGCLLTFFGFFKQCLCKLPCSQIILDVSGFGVQICLSLVWPIWRSQPCKTFGCEWGEAATFLLISQLCYLAAAIFSRCMRDPRYVRKQERPGE
jgi:hypothetical protein